jgi:hypothetical protein
MKVKIFFACNNTQNLEDNINKWIAEVNPKILMVTQCASGRYDINIATTIFYEEQTNV